MKYYQASLLAFCGEKEIALKLLRAAIAQNYCALFALDTDPLWASMRKMTEFSKARLEAEGCQKKFLAHRESS